MCNRLARYDSRRGIGLWSAAARTRSTTREQAFLEVLVASGDSRDLLGGHCFSDRVGALAVEELGNSDLMVSKLSQQAVQQRGYSDIGLPGRSIETFRAVALHS